VSPHGSEIIEQLRPGTPGVCQPIDFFRRKTQILEEIDGLLEPSAIRNSRRAGSLLIYRGLDVAVVQLGLDHIELIEI
jgi:hypothetical protein